MLTFLVILYTVFVQGFLITDVRPRDDMRPLGAVSINILDTSSGNGLIQTCISGQINHYLLWLNPANRPPAYLIDTRLGTSWVEVHTLAKIEC